MVAEFILSIQSLIETVTRDIARAERDNDLIYHQDVPNAANLEAIPEASVAQFTVIPGLKNPQSVLENENVIFGEMPSWGAVEAISKSGVLLINMELY